MKIHNWKGYKSLFIRLGHKCVFNQLCVSFLGHIINSNGISEDPQKTKAIINMSPPTNVTQLRQFLGMINQMSKFLSNLADLSHPLQQLLSPKRQWLRGQSQADSFEKLKAEFATPRVFCHYDVTADTKISADVSSYGLGAVLLQKHNGEWKPLPLAH